MMLAGWRVAESLGPNQDNLRFYSGCPGPNMSQRHSGPSCAISREIVRILENISLVDVRLQALFACQPEL